MKRILILLIAAGLMCTFPATALAGKPDKPPKPDPNETMMVTMTYEGAGIATTCGGELPMVRREPEFLRVDWGPGAPDVEMNLPDYFTGCHGGLVEGSADGFAGMFILDGQNDGTVRLFSRFDYEWQYEPHPKNPRRTVQSLLDLYEIDGILSGDFDWSTGGTLTGTLSVKNFHKAHGDGEWTDLGTTPVTITLEW
jgi:hypothetical protein